MPGVDVHPARIEKGIGKLVLTVVELVRRLLERQALRRIDEDSIAAGQIEDLGEALMKLETKMEELKNLFGLKDEDLNIDLGPLGSLM